MSLAPSPGSGMRSNGIRMPFIPASPMNSAYSDHSHAASTPTEMSVSIVAAPCLRFAHAALWNGQAPHSTTGVARFSASHCQLSNCSAGTIEMSSTGSDSSAERMSRWRSGAVASCSASRRAGVGRVGRRQDRLVAGGLDGADELLGGDRARVELDPGLLGGVVDGRGHAVELVELALDAVRARGARHARDGQLDVLERGAHRATSCVKAAVCTRPSVWNCRNRR